MRRWFEILPVGAAPETRLLLGARGVRAVGDGFVSLLLPVYLLELDYGPFETGIIATATLAGSAFLTLLVGLYAHRASARTLLIGAAILMMLTGIAFATFDDFWPLLLVAFVGTLNPSSGDVSVFLPLEQAQLARLVSDRSRTRLFARYSFIGSIMAAVGALGAALPGAAAELPGVALRPSLQAGFLVYAALGGLALLLYRRLPRAAEPGVPAQASQSRSAGRGASCSRSQPCSVSMPSPVAWSSSPSWRSGCSSASASPSPPPAPSSSGPACSRPCPTSPPPGSRTGSGSSTRWCSRTCRRILPSLVPFMPEPALAITLLLVRSALSQMDVPTRTLVRHGGRRAGGAAGGRQRDFSAAQPGRGRESGSRRRNADESRFGWPLVVAGGLKVVYDLLLLMMFRNVRPPEEAARRSRA